jgi:hypothetical protein
MLCKAATNKAAHPSVWKILANIKKKLAAIANSGTHILI